MDTWLRSQEKSTKIYVYIWISSVSQQYFDEVIKKMLLIKEEKIKD